MDHFEYWDAGFPVRSDLVDANRRAWAFVAGPGTWWTGSERVAIADEVRAARSCALCGTRAAALSPMLVTGRHDASSTLSDPVVDAVHRLVTDPTRLTQSWAKELMAGEVTDAHYVELVALVVFVLNVDVFHRALGLPEAELPLPSAGRPSGHRPEGLTHDAAWIPMLDSRPPGTDEADLFGDLRRPTNVLRALSLVPDAVRTLRFMEDRYYLPAATVLDLSDNAGRALTRGQIEYVATAVSTANRCFYCAASHGLLLDIGDGQEAPEHADLLDAFVHSVLDPDPEAVPATRDALLERMGAQGVVDAAALIGSFTRMNRIANATGIELDGPVNAMSGEVQAALGLRDYASAESTAAPSAWAARLATRLRPLLLRVARSSVRDRS